MAFAVLDVETTGLSPERDRIIEIALVRLAHNGIPVDEWTTRLDPEGPVGATHIHGIQQSDVAGQPLFRSLATQVAQLLGDLPVVAHNANFDLAFLRSEFSRAGWDMPPLRAFCTLGGSHEYFPSLGRRRLADCCWAAGIRHNQNHSALGDARATGALFAHYLARDPHLPARAGLFGTVAWPAGPIRQPTEWTAPRRGDRPLRISSGLATQPPLVRQLSALTLTDVLDEGAPVGSLVYLETLLSALEDGELSLDEAEQLRSLSQTYHQHVASGRIDSGRRQGCITLGGARLGNS
jgi:DNA polymerase-3 subunit epsilon